MSPDQNADASLLFTYGTLMLTTGIAAVDEATRNAGVSLGRAFIHGLLYDLGDYPGAVPWPGEAADEDAPKIWGRLIRLADPRAFFKVIDAYEGFDTLKPSESEFMRAETTVFLGDAHAKHAAQVYYYNLPTRGRATIPSGDYLAFWHALGRPGQGRNRA